MLILNSGSCYYTSFLALILILLCSWRDLSPEIGYLSKMQLHTREMLQEQATITLVDAINIDPDDEVTETISPPLFSVVPRGDYERFFEHISS